ncbi:MAG: hypothetical protein K8S55_07510 [Phycisphaerae bacterium]|nr:hypothetical protein [Phycisphaerae bacterium]
MERQFFLSSQDWGEPWGPRKCKYIATYKAKPTGQKLFYVRVSPALPKELGEGDSDVKKLLLGTIGAKWTLKDIGRFGFMVDIYIPKSQPERTAVNVKDLIRVGVGELSEANEMTNNKRQYHQFNPSKGFPASKSLSYECLNCGEVIPSLPEDSVHCTCRNIMIDADYGRISIQEPDLVRLFSETHPGD